MIMVDGEKVMVDNGFYGQSLICGWIVVGGSIVGR